MPTIRIDDEVYSWLKSQATPFEDTPNTVLRKIAGLDVKQFEAEVNNQTIEGDTKTVVTNREIRKPKQLSGKYLAELWGIKVKQAHYHKDGTWFQPLRHFPGGLFDPIGYIVFNTEKEYEESSYLQHGIELNVHEGIASIPGYRRVQP
jgi:hypothetical protein